MGLADRPYMRPASSRTRGPSGLGLRVLGNADPKRFSVVVWLIAINSAIFFLPEILRFSPIEVTVAARVVRLPDGSTTAFPVTQFMDPFRAYGHFSTFLGFLRGEVWRLVTFQFLHANFWHLALNMFGLWMFGRTIEAEMGRRKFLAFYLVGGIAGGLFYLLLNLLGALNIPFPDFLKTGIYTPLLGASAGVYAVVIGCGRLMPKAQVWVFGIIPMPLGLCSLGFVAIAAFNLIQSGPNAGGDAAHLGGAAAGWFFIKHHHLLNDFFDVFQNSNLPPRSTRPGRRTPRQPRLGAQPAPDRAADAAIDRILDKIAREGLDSLSDADRAALKQASADRAGPTPPPA